MVQCYMNVLKIALPKALTLIICCLFKQFRSCPISGNSGQPVVKKSSNNTKNSNRGKVEK